MSITSNWLGEVKLSELLETKDSGDLVRVYPGTTLDDACRVMAKNHILSVSNRDSFLPTPNSNRSLYLSKPTPPSILIPLLSNGISRFCF